tara:strand:- start:781 stop:981 length:201 start_codon:yes stop_codon:yes gene_type:complete
MAKGHITSRDLSGREGLTGIARKEAEKAKLNEKLLEKAIQHIESEKKKASAKDLKKKKEPKKKKSK